MTATDVSPTAPASIALPAPGEFQHVRTPGWLDDRLVAVIFAVVGIAAAAMIVPMVKADPVSIRGAAMPLGLGFGVFAVLLFALHRWWGRFGPAMTGAVVGAYAGWVALVTKGALYGTVMSYGGNIGDAHRITAQATKYATSWGSTNVFLPNTPSDYPPLYTWLTGRASQALGEPAWQLMQNTEVLWLAATVVVAYVLWRRLVSAPVAAVIAMLTFAADNNPIKPYEVIALAVTVPWILATVGQPARGRLHWLPAGLVGGLIFLTYNGYVVFTGLGTLAIGWWAWRQSTDRRAYVAHLLKVALVAFVVASWYVVPYLWAILTRPHGSFGSDTFASTTISTDPLPLHFFDVNPAGALQLIGIAGLVFYYQKAWWARPMAALLAGTYAFFIVGAIRFVLTRHTMFYHYAIAAIAAIVMVALTAGVLSVAEALQTFSAHRYAPRVRWLVAVLTVATLA